METTVFGLEESAADRSAALHRYVGVSMPPAPAGGMLAPPVQQGTTERPQVAGAPVNADTGWSEALTRARDVSEEYGAFTHVPDPGERPSDLVIGATGGLAGVPVAIKDNIAVRGLPLSASSAVLDGHIADRDAVVVERLRASGAWVVGKAALDEFAFGTLGPGIANPTFPGLTVGGSSGGSAVAVAAGACPTSVGTDTGGSVRIPAACTGVVGFKPTPGWVSNDGLIPLSWSLDTIGLFATSVEEVATVYGEIRGERHSEPLVERALEDLRVARPDAHYLRVATGVVMDGFSETCGLLGRGVARVGEVALPDSDDSLHVQYLVVLPESASYHRGRWGAERGGYTEGVRLALERGDAVRATDYLTAQRARGAMRVQVEQALGNYDVLVMPTMAIDPPVVGAEEATIGDGRTEDAVSAMLRFTALFNHVGFPAISLPLATADGVPRGLQVVGHPGRDSELLMAARSIAEMLGA